MAVHLAVRRPPGGTVEIPASALFLVNAADGGALGGTRTPNLLIRSKASTVHTRPRQSVAAGSRSFRVLGGLSTC